MSEARQRAVLARLHALAKAEIAAALRLVDPGDSASLASVVVDVVPVIAERYGLAAGALAADWYEDQREAAEVAGYFSAQPAQLPSQGRYESMAAWVANKDDVEALVSGGVQRVIANAHRETVMESSFADPQAEGWARFSGGGDGSCAFCFMLISRGAVYRDGASAKFGAHDDCNCGAGPVWKGRDGIEKVRKYAKGARRREDSDGNAIGATAADQERAKEWIAQHLD